jgi:hypothetical protein
MSQWVRPAGTAWIAREQIPGPDVDEFADPHHVERALAEACGPSLLAVQHPHRTAVARAAGAGLQDSLPGARSTLRALQRRHYRQASDVVALYRARGERGAAIGVLCLVDPAAADAAGQQVIRDSEGVYPQVVCERAAVLAALGVATSAAMLVPVHTGSTLTTLLQRLAAESPAPAVDVTDPTGTRHELWVLQPGPAQRDVLAAAATDPLLVADGNHRVAAARAAGSGGLLALITDGPDLRVGAIHRGLVAPGWTVDSLAAAWRSVGLRVETATDTAAPQTPGTVITLAPGGALRVRLPEPSSQAPRPCIDHSVVERLLVAEALGIEPDGGALRALPEGQADDPEVTVLLQIAPVPLADVLAVHEQGRRMPRKSTYFTPKPRSGLFLADVRA